VCVFLFYFIFLFRVYDNKSQVCEIELDSAERDFYECVYKRTQAKFDTYVQKGAVLHNYGNT
jgi:hypothetical protein